VTSGGRNDTAWHQNADSQKRPDQATFDDPESNNAKTLSQIDTVFVTAGPKREGRKPSGKPLLFTYLRILRMTPTHPEDHDPEKPRMIGTH